VALLLAPSDEAMAQQLDALKAAGTDALGAHAAALNPSLRKLGAAFHLPVIDLALPAAKSLPEDDKQRLAGALEAVIQSDRRVSLHEFVVLAFVRHQLLPKGKPGAAGSRRLSDLKDEAFTLLSLMAQAGVRADATGERQQALMAAIAAGAKEMGLAPPPSPPALTIETADKALQALKSLAPMQKAVLVKGLFAAVTADGTIRVAEAELMRLAGAVLDCPLPPLLEAVDPATLVA
jgi:hypothetical protein